MFFNLLAPNSFPKKFVIVLKPNLMKQLLLFSLLALSIYSSAQDTSYTHIYEPVVGELDNNYPVADAALVWDEGLIATGGVGWDSRGFIIRIEPDGSMIWQKECTADPSVSGLYFNDIATLRDSSFVIAGKVLDTVLNAFRPFCMKLNAAGDTLWTKTLTLQNAAAGNYGTLTKKNGYVIETSDSMILMGFYHSSFETSSANPDHLCLTKLTSNGDVVWSKSFLAEDEFFLSDMVVAMDSSIYVVGYSDEASGTGYLLNFSSEGQINWSRKYVGMRLHDIKLDSTYLYLGWTDATFEAGVVKLLLNGDHQIRVSLYVPVSWDAPRIRLCRRSNGNVVVTGAPNSNFDFGEMVELNENLDFVQSYAMAMIMNGVTSIPDKGIYATGYGPIYGVKKVGDVELGLVRFDSLMQGSICAGPSSMTINILSAIPMIPVIFAASDSILNYHTPVLYQDMGFVSEVGCVQFYGSVDELVGSWNETVSPNPSSRVFTISWRDYREVELTVFNSIGNEIYRGSVKHSSAEIDLADQESGLYYYRLVDAEGTQSCGKLSLIP